MARPIYPSRSDAPTLPYLVRLNSDYLLPRLNQLSDKKPPDSGTLFVTDIAQNISIITLTFFEWRPTFLSGFEFPGEGNSKLLGSYIMDPR
jgi:hypothetical protein